MNTFQHSPGSSPYLAFVYPGDGLPLPKSGDSCDSISTNHRLDPPLGFASPVSLAGLALMGIVPVDLRFIVSGISIEVLAANSHGARRERPARPTLIRLLAARPVLASIVDRMIPAGLFRSDDVTRK